MSAWRGSWDELDANGLRTGEVIECHGCGERFDRADLDNWEGEPDPLGCPDCGCESWTRGYLHRERKDKKVAARLGEDVAACGFVAIPNVLLEHSSALELSALDLQLLALIELHRRESEQAWPSEKLLVDLTGVSLSTVDRRLRRMRDRGLIEWTREHGLGGRWEHRVYTRHGLDRVCQLLAANRRNPRDPDLPAEERRVHERAGLPELLGELANHRSPATGGPTDHQSLVRGGEVDTVHETPENGPTTGHGWSPPPVTGALHHRSPTTNETEAVEVETGEADSAHAARLRRVERDEGTVEKITEKEPDQQLEPETHPTTSSAEAVEVSAEDAAALELMATVNRLVEQRGISLMTAYKVVTEREANR